ncbi:MAG: hypothetical protein KDJ47_12320 [Hyphomicrobiaceae bacterium]|nr:hypothetical protein [Hyphomicrobiaceae bacterium]
MKRFRLYATIFVLGLGAGMAATYVKPDPPSAPERINTEHLRQEASPVSHAVTRISPEANTQASYGFPPAQASEASMTSTTPPTVVAPSGPLLRSATSAPPIDTSSPSDATAPVLHGLPSSTQALTATGVREIQTNIGGENSALAVSQEPIPVEAGTPGTAAESRRQVRRSSPAPRQRTASGNSKRVESLFLNPLGVR